MHVLLTRRSIKKRGEAGRVRGVVELSIGIEDV